MTDNQPINIDSAVTTIILQRPQKHHVQAYEDWLKEIVPISKRFEGHRGVNVIRPHAGQDEYTIVLHFDSEQNLRKWLESDTRKELIEKVKPLLNSDESIEIQSGIEYWFTPHSAQKTAPAHKQYLITLSAIFPLTVLVPLGMEPLFALHPLLENLLVKKLIVAMVLVWMMIYVVMPRYVRLVSRWLYR